MKPGPISGSESWIRKKAVLTGTLTAKHYHDEEWGVPCRDEQKLTEFFVLKMFQAGLSWKSILHKREAFRDALDGFDIEKIAAYASEILLAIRGGSCGAV